MLWTPGDRIKISGRVIGGLQFHPVLAIPQAHRASLMRQTPGLSEALPLHREQGPGRKAPSSTDGAWWILKEGITCLSHWAATIIAGLWVHCQLEWQLEQAAAVTDGSSPASCSNGIQANSNLFFPLERKKKEKDPYSHQLVNAKWEKSSFLQKHHFSVSF